jgi:hypothetical protein
MADYDIDRNAANDAAAILRNLLEAEVPEGDFTEGSAASDLLIDGHAIITGYLQKQITTVRQRQSLLTLANLPASESVNDAADALLANFFRTRRLGGFATGVVTLRFNQKQDVLVPRGTRFFKTPALVFYIDSDTDLLIPATDLRADLDANGLVVSFSTTLFVAAERVGAEYNIEPGTFIGFDRFSALLISVTNYVSFNSGTSMQTTSDFVSKSKNAISLRALINARSNDSLLIDRFTSIRAITTVGYGDPEMLRDLVRNVSNTVALHVGGHMDIFVRQDVQEVVDQYIIGGIQTRNDGLAVTLRHATLLTDTAPARASYTAARIVPGDILKLSGLPEGLFEYVVTAVRANEIEIADRTPFSIATDEGTTPTPLSYTIGDNYPLFNNKIVVPTPTVNAVTTRQFSEFNRFQMGDVPIYQIKSIEVLAPLPLGLQPYADAASGNAVFTTRKNTPTLSAPSLTEDLGFYVTVKNPEAAQSSRAMTMVEIGWPALNLTGTPVNVSYETLSGFTAVHTYVVDRMNRPACSNTLVRAYHPLYLYASIPYRPRTTPFSPLSTVIPVFDAAVSVRSLIAYINAYQETEPIDVSLLATTARQTSTAIASIYTFKIYYDFILPDGRVLSFETDDKITLFPDSTSSARLTNPVDFGMPATGYEAALHRFLLDQGVSDRVTRYRATSGNIVFERRT